MLVFNGGVRAPYFFEGVFAMEFVKRIEMKHAVFGTGDTVDVFRAGYAVGKPALVGVMPDGEQWGIFTVNVLGANVADGNVLVKNYSENEGVLQDLIDAGIVGKPVGKIPVGFVSADECELLV